MAFFLNISFLPSGSLPVMCVYLMWPKLTSLTSLLILLYKSLIGSSSLQSILICWQIVHTLNDCGYNVRYMGNTVTGIHYVQSSSYIDEQNRCWICSLILTALWRAATLNATHVFKTPIRWFFFMLYLNSSKRFYNVQLWQIY